MGLNTNITILNDTIHEINEDPVKWWNETVYPQICSSKPREYLKKSGTTVNSVQDSTSTTIIAVGGNHSTVLGYTSGVHHTEEGQIQILKQLANKLGYNLTKKRNTNS